MDKNLEKINFAKKAVEIFPEITKVASEEINSGKELSIKVMNEISKSSEKKADFHLEYLKSLNAEMQDPSTPEERKKNIIQERKDLLEQERLRHSEDIQSYENRAKQNRDADGLVMNKVGGVAWRILAVGGLVTGKMVYNAAAKKYGLPNIKLFGK